MRGERLGLQLTAPPGGPRRAAVLGAPVGHSLSPVLHRAAWRALGPPWSGWDYERIECDELRLPVLLAAAGAEWVGFSATMPLKHAAVALADELTDQARAVGAANTLLRTPRGWRAANTDVAGIVAALRERAAPDPARGVAVIGAGGTAQAAVAALAELGFPAVTVLARDPARAERVQATAARVGVELEVAPLSEGLPGADLVVCTLPPRAADGLRFEWRAGQSLLDVAYDPWPSALATGATDAGVTVVSGALMLLHQAAEQVRLMTGQPAPVEAMRSALAAHVPAGAV